MGFVDFPWTVNLQLTVNYLFGAPQRHKDNGIEATSVTFNAAVAHCER